jgi:polar amino acid transport system permease protein
MIPPLAGQFVRLVKDSSLLMLIPGIVELMRRTDMIRNSIQKPFEPLLLVCGLYFLICFSLSLLARRLELRLAD